MEQRPVPWDVPDNEKLKTALSFRLTKPELDGLNALCAEHCLTQSQMLRRLVRTGSGLPTIPRGDAVQAISGATEELRRIGVNLNQAVRAMHEGRASFAAELAKGLLAVVEVVAGMQETFEQSMRAERLSARKRIVEGG